MRQRLSLVASFVVLVLGVAPAFASHGWGSYHWGRSCSTCAANITVYDTTATTNTNWSDHLSKALFGDPANPNTANRRGWNDSAVLTLTRTFSTASRSTCAAVSGAIRVCNYTYGANGWLGLAQISLGSNNHIAWATTKVNDTYFNTGSYPNTEKRHVMCQEVGHDFGLGHTSENGSSQNTCMDYYQNTSNSDWTSTGPNQHDFDQLLTQHHYGAMLPPSSYSLLGDTSIAADADDDYTEPWQWGTPFEFDPQGRAIGFRLDLGDRAMFTFVRWADPERAAPEHGPRQR